MTTAAGTGGFARWACEAGGTACPSFALTLTSVDKVTTGQTVRFGSGSNTHGTLDVTLPSSGCAACTTMPVGDLIVHATF